ncbi:histone-lysine N-methyltransferase ash1 isoform X2 [Scaptodrosophila lebanonensis]|uniref:Histone-lysine N-methyltransferase ash1 isoform X2 n=1 Tax=Drosophila lebanonensis TaxID=7225 RepID=A0A6J2T7L4_DROLE|nr:histone-lysine N-methyltransferase ash1 isoform X2 [Scaptodrosophila lebanonensis]
MSSGQNETARAAKVLETQCIQESGSENEETDSITDQSSKSSAAQQQHEKSTKTATQFSVQSSDTDGLRMRISAIRPPTSTTSGVATTTSTTTSLSTNHSKLSELKSSLKARKMSASLALPTSALAHFSDATESGCSEATTTTIAHGIKDKTTNATTTGTTATKKIKVKRKKIAQKNNNSNNTNNNNNNSSCTGHSKQVSKKPRLQSAFSSDSEDDLPLKIHQQRAPRLLLTAIGHASSSSFLQVSNAPGSDNIGNSSSDNELPNLVKAAIKRVESDTEDTTVEGSFRKAAKTKQLPQYQSTLLQDFMEKTQMLGKTAACAATAAQSSPALGSSQSDSMASSISRKRRGRPKKQLSTAVETALAIVPINESADSGVISTTSTTQSTTPSPKMQVSNNNNENLLPTSAKPKIDMAYLDKRMYATERVLYPPPRNKRRQGNKKSQKEELQLDPVWREIDVNKKFRLRSVSGYKSDGGGTGGGITTTICSKILAAKSGYVSDYGSVRHQRSTNAHNSGYKSDASCKSRFSVKSCMSRRSRAKSCGYRSDCKESGKLGGGKLRRRRRASMLLKGNAATANSGITTNPSDEQDILQLAGLSLGQSSEESNEYISKPSLQNLPTTSASKKYGEINRYVTTGQYFGRGDVVAGASSTHNPDTFINKMLLQRKHSIGREGGKPSPPAVGKIKSRRSSAASMCSSYISGTSRMRRRHRRKSLCLSRSSTKMLNIDSKLLTEIDIITSTFHTRCRIQDDRLTASSGKEKLMAEANKLQQTLAGPLQPLLSGGSSTGTGSTNNVGNGKPLKRALKKRKLSEPLVDFAMLSAGVNASASASKRRHKKSAGTSSSPDDHKLPLKKRHYLLTPGERPPADVAAAFAAGNSKLNAEAWAAAAATAKSTASTKSQAQFNARAANCKSALTPKKRHLLESSSRGENSCSSSSPLRIVVDTNSISGGKLLDISPSSLCSLKQQRRQRVEVNKQKSSAQQPITAMLQSPASYPPPGIFEPSVELEIQIPMAKLNESVITKAEVSSPLLTLDINEDPKKEQCTRVVESLLHKTGGHVLLKRKRKKINRTGFPTVRRKKRKVSDATTLPEQGQLDKEETEQQPAPQQEKISRETRSSTALIGAMDCERVPLTGEARETFVARSNQRTPRLSVVALERLQGSPRPTTPAKSKTGKTQPQMALELRSNSLKRKGRKPDVVSVPGPSSNVKPKMRGRPKATQLNEKPAQIAPKANNKFQTNIKLPAGVDPNTNFSCKIRLKRRKTLIKPLDTKESSEQVDEPPSTAEEIDKEAAAKYSGHLPTEHEPLPLSEALRPNQEEASCDDTSDEKSSNASNITTVTAARKLNRLKKNYLVAGLFSNYYKQSQMPPPPKLSKKIPGQLEELQPNNTSLLPPPPYCERYHRRTQIDFELPYDIWWAYTNAKLPTRQVVPSWNYRKIRTNVYAESVRPNLAGFDHPTCNCKPDAACMDNCLNRMVYTECSPSNCPAGDKCRNQKIQKHEVAPGVERFMTADKGWGVRTKLHIPKGTYILEYVGEVVTEREFKERMGTIYLNDTHHYCLHLDGGLVIDGQRMGSDCRFVNHSCEPNCEMQKWSVNGLSRMVLFAKRPIEQGEELTYDYNFSLFNPSEGQPCRCNTPQCRGVIGGKSQRVKPLPVEIKPVESTSPNTSKDARNGRQRKHKARKHAQRQPTKEVAVARVQQLSEKEKKLVKQCNIFLVRNFEKIRRCKAKRAAKAPVSTDGTVSERRPSTPSSSVTLAAQISALCTPRNIKTRGLTHAVQDPEVEKMAKMAVLLRDICNALEALKMSELLSSVATSKKKKALKSVAKVGPRVEFKTIQAQVEQGHYKTPQEYDEQMLQLFADARQTHSEDEGKAKALETLLECYEQQKHSSYAQLLDILGEAQALQSFKPKQADVVKLAEPQEPALKNVAGEGEVEVPAQTPPRPAATLNDDNEEDVIRCICGLYKDEGLMIQCAKCMVWQHTECTKADIDADNYQCERCEPRQVDREIPLEEFTEEGHRYYLSLMRGDLQVRQGDAVYVLRDIPIKDEQGKVVPSQKHTYETIGAIDYQECDIFRVEHLWKNDAGKRFIFGHHFLRPHETFHEPSRRFYPNEVVRVSLYEVVPIELVIGRCWVLDRTTFCKGRPMECTDEDHCYICELRVDKTARFFSKAKANYPTCTKSYAFRKFPEKLKISKSYAPHDVDSSLLKTKKQKTDNEVGTLSSLKLKPRLEQKTGQTANQCSGSVGGGTRKPRTANSVVATTSPAVHIIAPAVPNVQLVKKKRMRLENILITMKLKCLDAQTAQEQPIDLSYLLSGRGARQRKTNNNHLNSASPSA